MAIFLGWIQVANLIGQLAQLNEDNLDRIQQLTNQLDSAMMESSSQHYTYETELVSVSRTRE